MFPKRVLNICDTVYIIFKAQTAASLNIITIMI